MTNIFLDANAHLPISKRAMKALADFNASPEGHANAMSPSPLGLRARAKMEKARASIAKHIGALPNQLFFTSTCSQACEWAVEILEGTEADYYYTSPFEHPAVSHKVHNELPNAGKMRSLKNGMVDVPVFKARSSAAICIYYQNETGVIQPIVEMNPTYLFSDMSQALGKAGIDLGGMYSNVSIATFGAHKFGGPVGIGILYLKDTEMWEEFGSGSRYVLDRPGTPDVAGIVAAAAALDEAMETLPERMAKALKFLVELENGLQEMGFVVISKDAPRGPWTTFVKVPKRKALTLMADLGNAGVHVGLGSACGAMNVGPSPLIEAMGLDGDLNDYIRISQFGEYGTEDAKMVLSKIKRYL